MFLPLFSVLGGLKTEWCFTCEFERLVFKGKQGKSSLSPGNILSGLSNAGSPFGVGREEDAHEFMKYENTIHFIACNRK